MKISIPKIRVVVTKALSGQRNIVKQLETEKHNPSVAKNYYSALGKVEALEAVLDALSDNNITISLL